MTAREMSSAIGQSVYYMAGELRFTCTIVDVKIGWGQPRFLIRPHAGTGEKWVEFSSIEPVKTQRVVGPNQVLMIPANPRRS